MAEVVKMAQKRLYYLKDLRKNNIPENLLESFYCSTVESILAYCISACFSSCTVPKRKELYRSPSR